MRKETRLSRLYCTLLITICLLVCFYPYLSAQETISDRLIHLKWGNVQPTANAVKWLDSMQQTPQNSPVQVLLQFNSLPANDQRKLLGENGIILSDYVPDNTFIAFIRFPVQSANISNIPIN